MWKRAAKQRQDTEQVETDGGHEEHWHDYVSTDGEEEGSDEHSEGTQKEGVDGDDDRAEYSVDGDEDDDGRMEVLVVLLSLLGDAEKGYFKGDLVATLMEDDESGIEGMAQLRKRVDDIKYALLELRDCLDEEVDTCEEMLEGCSNEPG